MELDYGGLVHLVDDDALRDDASVAEVAEALGHLSAGRATEAVELYERVAVRWRQVAAREQAN